MDRSDKYRKLESSFKILGMSAITMLSIVFVIMNSAIADERFGSPIQTLRTFVRAADKGDISTMRNCIDFRGVTPQVKQLIECQVTAFALVSEFSQKLYKQYPKECKQAMANQKGPKDYKGVITASAILELILARSKFKVQKWPDGKTAKIVGKNIYCSDFIKIGESWKFDSCGLEMLDDPELCEPLIKNARMQIKQLRKGISLIGQKGQTFKSITEFVDTPLPNFQK